MLHHFQPGGRKFVLTGAAIGSALVNYGLIAAWLATVATMVAAVIGGMEAHDGPADQYGWTARRVRELDEAAAITQQHIDEVEAALGMATEADQPALAEQLRELLQTAATIAETRADLLDKS